MGNTDSNVSNENTASSSSALPSETPHEEIPIVHTEEIPETEESNTPESTLSYWHMIKHGYTELVHCIIRPPRAEYNMVDLGPLTFTYCNRAFQRTDLELPNARGETLVCSFWEPVKEERLDDKLPVLIYLHGNSSCRIEAIGILRVALTSGMTVFAFDFSGCGKSGGEYISLGYYERDDLHTVTEYLRNTERISTIGLWGRSMGAATALLHADRDPSIAGIILDSAFCDLETLAQEMVQRGRTEGYILPHFLVKLALKMIRSSVQKRAQFDIRKLCPIEHADRSFIPALFVAAKDDTFIQPHHSQQIHDAYAGEKNFILVDGDHNSIRPPFLLDSASIFLQRALHIPSGHTLPDPCTNSSPPWSRSFRMEEMLYAACAASFDQGQEKTLDVPTIDWPCTRCTFFNSKLSNTCVMCEGPYQLEEQSTSPLETQDTTSLESHRRDILATAETTSSPLQDKLSIETISKTKEPFQVESNNRISPTRQTTECPPPPIAAALSTEIKNKQ